MEALGAVSIFSRSEANHQLWYLNFYGDGDSKSFSSVQNIYPGHKVIKYECIGHVQKRMGNRLRKRRKRLQVNFNLLGTDTGKEKLSREHAHFNIYFS